MKLYYLKREKGRNEILETNISDRLYHSDNFAALLERICQQFPCVSVGYPASGADYDRAASILSDVGKKFRLFEIHFELDGAEVQPNGIVTVYYPIPEGYDADKVVLYRINDDGTKTLVKGTVENGFYKVMTKSFSTYALVEQGSTITDAENSANVGSDIPQTGDSTNVLPFALLALASAGMIGVLFVSRKRKFTEGE